MARKTVSRKRKAAAAAAAGPGGLQGEQVGWGGGGGKGCVAGEWGEALVPGVEGGERAGARGKG